MLKNMKKIVILQQKVINLRPQINHQENYQVFLPVKVKVPVVKVVVNPQKK